MYKFPILHLIHLQSVLQPFVWQVLHILVTAVVAFVKYSRCIIMKHTQHTAEYWHASCSRTKYTRCVPLKVRAGVCWVSLWICCVSLLTTCTNNSEPYTINHPTSSWHLRRTIIGPSTVLTLGLHVSNDRRGCLDKKRVNTKFFALHFYTLYNAECTEWWLQRSCIFFLPY